MQTNPSFSAKNTTQSGGVFIFDELKRKAPVKPVPFC
jgi:hypothetical protein